MVLIFDEKDGFKFLVGPKEVFVDFQKDHWLHLVKEGIDLTLCGRLDMLLQRGLDSWRNSEVNNEVNLAKAVNIQAGHHDIHLIELVLGILIIIL